MSYKNVTCVCEKKEIKNNKEREKNQSRKAALDPPHTICLGQHSGFVMKEGLFYTLFQSFIHGEAVLRLTILIRHVSCAG